MRGLELRERPPPAVDPVAVKKRHLGTLRRRTGGNRAAGAQAEHVRGPLAADVPGQTVAEDERLHATGPVFERPVALHGERVRRDVASLFVERFNLREGRGGDVNQGSIQPGEAGA